MTQIEGTYKEIKYLVDRFAQAAIVKDPKPVRASASVEAYMVEVI